MNYEVIAIDKFKKDAKRLVKKYPSLRQEIILLGEQLALNPTLGIPIGNDCYKIRLSIGSKGRGKSGGARVVTFVFFKKAEVYLLSVYDKSEKETLPSVEIFEIVSRLID
jgi:mRNA-degrading endonuclease RelE of RelBE toxin-antitoxin system